MGPAIITIKGQETLVSGRIISWDLSKVAQVIRLNLDQGIVDANEVLERAID